MPRRSRNALFTIREPSAAPTSRRRCRRQKTQPELGQIVQPCKPMHCTRSRSSHPVRRQLRHWEVGSIPDTERETEKTPIGETHPCSNKPSRCSDRHLASSCPSHQAAGLQRTARSPLVPYDLLRKPIEGAAREAQGQTHRVRAAIGSGEDSTTRARRQIAERGGKARLH